MLTLFILVIVAVALAIVLPLVLWLYVWDAERTLHDAHTRLAHRVSALERAHLAYDERNRNA